MVNQIVAIAQEQAQAAIRRAAIPAALGVIALVLFLFTLFALFVALFFWLMPIYGPLTAALIVAAAAFVLAVVALLLTRIGRRPKPPPPPDPMVPQLVTLLAQTAPSLGPRTTAWSAVLLALALGLMARGSSARRK
jgi:Putative Actinobacterial Holin-X, holin superfamily III